MGNVARMAANAWATWPAWQPMHAHSWWRPIGLQMATALCSLVAALRPGISGRCLHAIASMQHCYSLHAIASMQHCYSLHAARFSPLFHPLYTYAFAQNHICACALTNNPLVSFASADCRASSFVCQCVGVATQPVDLQHVTTCKTTFMKCKIDSEKRMRHESMYTRTTQPSKRRIQCIATGCGNKASVAAWPLLLNICAGTAHSLP
jgi:hypothetical protein